MERFEPQAKGKLLNLPGTPECTTQWWLSLSPGLEAAVLGTLEVQLDGSCHISKQSSDISVCISMYIYITYACMYMWKFTNIKGPCVDLKTGARLLQGHPQKGQIYGTSHL